MASIAERPHGPVNEPNFLEINNGKPLGTRIFGWMVTLDHKRIGMMYLFGILTSLLIGGFFALLVRTELWSPGETIVGPETYNKFFTLHGAVMVFLVIIPGIPAALGNIIMPIQLGAPDVAFPKLNLASFYLWTSGALLLVIAIPFGGLDTGWTLYTPYSLKSQTPVLIATAGVFLLGFSSIFTGLNFLVTIHKFRPQGMGWFQLPLNIWAIYATAIMQVLATPVLGITVLLLSVERFGHIGIFDPNLGGDPVLFQHFFWFYSHPAVYIMIIPAMGVISELISTFARKPLFGYRFVAYSSVSLALLSFLVWGHHMFVSGQSRLANMVFSALTFTVGIPSAIKVFNWVATLYKGDIRLKTPMLYALSFLLLFTIGGLTGLFLGILAVDVHLHDTYFVVAHFHYVMMGSTLVAFLGALHYWWPKFTGRMYNESLGKICATGVFFGFNLTFLPQFVMGARGMPRRYWDYDPQYQIFHQLSTIGAYVLGISLFVSVMYLIASFWTGKKATRNPWGGSSLEWQAPTPPPLYNFEKPPVMHELYNYDDLVEVGEDDWIRQDELDELEGRRVAPKSPKDVAQVPGVEIKPKVDVAAPPVDQGPKAATAVEPPGKAVDVVEEVVTPPVKAEEPGIVEKAPEPPVAKVEDKIETKAEAVAEKLADAKPDDAKTDEEKKVVTAPHGAHDDGHGHGSRFIQHHYDDAKHQFDSGKLGIWLFLAQEVLFFSALFVAYILYRVHHPEIYLYAHKWLDVKMGAINTAVLIFSSLTAAWAVRCAQLSQRTGLIGCIVVTILCACTFMGVKYKEYSHKYHEGILFGQYFDPCVSSGGTELLTKKNECAGAKSTVEWDAGSQKAKTGCWESSTIDQDLRTEGVQAKCIVKANGTVVANECPEETFPGDADADSEKHGLGTKTPVVEKPARKFPCWRTAYQPAVCPDLTTADQANSGKAGRPQVGILVEFGDEEERGDTFKVTAECTPAAKVPEAADAFADKDEAIKTGAGAIHRVHELTEEQEFERAAAGPPPEHTNMFLSIYFAMTGLHGIHVLFGIGVFLWLLVRSIKGHFTPDYFGPIDFAALYWHIVDLIWIFLFPLLYLIH